MRYVVIILLLVCVLPIQAYAKEETSVYVIETTATPESLGITPRYEFSEGFTGFSAEITKSQADALKAQGMMVEENNMYAPKLAESVPFVYENEARESRYTGKGVKVAVIDTGIDYTHPDLAKQYKGGLDLIDGDKDPMETKSPATFHGTHVAGIIAANGRIKGVAPEADLYVYRALGPMGMGTTEQVLRAIDAAVKEGVDVINLSLGNAVNGPDWPTSVALDRVVDKGIVAVTSSGNSGPGLWSVGSPGTSSKAISVGASTPPLRLPSIHVNDKEIPLEPMLRAAPWTLTRAYEIVSLDYGEEADYESADVAGKIVLVKRGRISFTDKANFAKANGAKALLIANNREGIFAGMLEESINLPVASITNDQAKLIQDSKKPLRTIYHLVVDTVAPFSSRGPVTHTWEMKPDLVAPGVQIDSTTPNGYTSLNGTSMAAPHVAGAAALLLEKHPDWTPEQIKAALINSAKLLTDDQGDPLPAYAQGAGRLDINAALDATILLTPEPLRDNQPFTLHMQNVTDTPQTLRITSEITDALEVTLSAGETKKVTLPVSLQAQVAGIHTAWLQANIVDSDEAIDVPISWIVDEPDYPRVTSFMLQQEEHGGLSVEAYLPEGADHVQVTLYDSVTRSFIGVLHDEKQVKRGIYRTSVDVDVGAGTYIVSLTATKGAESDGMEEVYLVGAEALSTP
ncbi:S8 family serine peptidase [Paenalkalicoccus suaedae]|uniref:S8 family serine peptidase n=1 Tax=Paenalkalicoccus suaedae TaxID=2592382 RepID=A0A859FJA4_9BACI|nr:S8 family serine peptidase [Paenalkalicoccus suaedae]QKS72756.1 S8 family serine peptidase [Paenalkalicoccus suaedae]